MPDLSSPIVTFGDYLNNLFSGFVGRLIIAIIILQIGFIIGTLLGKLIEKILFELKTDKNIKKIGISFPVENLIGHVISISVYFVSIVMAIDVLRLTRPIINFIVIVVAIFTVLGILLGIKDFVPNLISGLFINRKQLFKKGDQIKFKSVEGIVIKRGLIETQIETKSKDQIYIPNKALLKDMVVIKKN